VEKKMDWVLFIVIVSTSTTDKAINSSHVPIATQQLCNAAKAQLIEAYKETRSPNFILYAECLKARQVEERDLPVRRSSTA
jgi:hypothetical protein